MDKYIVGNNEIDGYILLEYNDVAEEELQNCLVHYIIDTDDESINHYDNIRKLIINRNDVNVLIDENLMESNINSCMLMASYQRYGVYKVVNSQNTIDANYLKGIESRKPTVEEIEKFIGNVVVSYGEIANLLMNLQMVIKDGDVDKLINYIDNNMGVITESTKVIDYMKFMIGGERSKIKDISEQSKVDELSERMATLESELSKSRDKEKNLEDDCKKQKELVAKTEEKLNKSNEEVEKLRKEKEKVEKALKDAEDKLGRVQEGNTGGDTGADLGELEDKYKKEIDGYKNKILSLEELISASGPILSHYSEIQLSNVKAKVKSVIYFKEISYVRYTNSFIMNMLSIINKVHKLKAKLLVYEYKNDFLNIYKPFEIVGSSEYMADRNRVSNTLDKMVVVDQQPGIMEDVLRSDCDVLIIYDRLKRKNDILTGNTVYKYWVVNSSSEIAALNSISNVEYGHILTRPSVFQDCLAVRDIPGYKEKTSSAKLSEYTKLLNSGRNNKKLFEIIFNRTNVVNIKREE